MRFGSRPLLRCVAALLLLAVACEVPVRTSRAADMGLCRTGMPADTALQACSDIIQAGKLRGADLSDAYYVRALIWRGRNDSEHLLSDLNDAVRIDPSNVQALIARAIFVRQRKSYDLARGDLDAAIAADPKSAPAFFQRGFLRREQGDRDGALDDYTRSLQIDPDQHFAYNNRGFIRRERKELDLALSDFNESLKIAPNYPNAHLGRGEILADKGDKEGAIAEFTVAIASNPRYADAYFQRALVKRKAGDNDGALADHTDAIRLNPKHAFAYLNRGIMKRTAKDLDGALADFNQAIAADPTLGSAYTNRGLTYETKGDTEHALTEFRTAMSLPVKYDNGQWAYNTAKTRLAALLESSTKAEDTNLFAQPARQSAKVALVLGNGSYANVPKLPNPPADAHAVASGLRDIGFTVIEGTDLGRRDMEEKIVEFLRSVPNARIALLFYAGHGVQIDGRNYLVPIDAKSITRATLAFELVDVDRVLSGLDDESRANIIILDACRDDPLETRTASRSANARGGLAAYSDVASGMLVAFATAPGKTAADGSGKNSPFTTALLKYMKTKVEVNEMLRQVRVEVYTATNKQQLPWANSSLLGQVYLSGASGASN
jgi:tetratricopeptide (TPR) repeat protein